MMIQDFAEIEIVDIDQKGRGIGYISNIPIYVYFSLPGERVRVKITKGKKKNEYIGEIIEILKESAHRVKPFCKHFGSCGGCKLQHAEYLYQLKLKRNFIKKQLNLNEVYDIKVSDIIPSRTQYFRNKVELTFWPPDILGFKKPEKWNETIDLEECYLVSPLLNEILEVTKSLIRKYNIQIYDRETTDGYLRFLIYREGKFINSNLLAIITKNINEKIINFMKELCDYFSNEIENCLIGINDRLSDIAYAFRIEKIKGNEYYKEKLNNIFYNVHVNSFFQPNVYQFINILEKIKKIISGETLVYDLYCGIGTIGLYVADSVEKIIGIEVEPCSIEMAKINAKENDIKNVEFILGKVEHNLKLLENINKSTVILDPPRSGIHPRLRKFLLKNKPESIIYISCNPVAQIKDIKQFMKYYEIENNTMYLYDMFPHTMHLESLVILRRK